LVSVSVNTGTGTTRDATLVRAGRDGRDGREPDGEPDGEPEREPDGEPDGGAGLRLARVVHGSSPRPLLALERDGALYDAGELERVFRTRFSPDRLAGAADFHTRTIALGGAGLDELDERLRAGDRPGVARLLPGTFGWLPPCDTDRALHVQMAPHDEPAAEPLHRLGDARGLLGHESLVPFPPGPPGPPDPPASPGAGSASFALGVAAVLREDLSSADPAEVGRAVLGYAILNGWTGGDEETRPGWQARRVPAQLGPVLVTPDELGEGPDPPDLGRLKAQIRIDGGVTASLLLGGGSFSLAESVAWVSRWMDLRAGDVIGAGQVRGGRGEVRWGAAVELSVERLGRLSGRPVLRAG
jgi:2-keto-4-pentenoate hydratase/2-oxohepta-3-ene-1,7-dioic acid hydratase in catechol pathway